MKAVLTGFVLLLCVARAGAQPGSGSGSSAMNGCPKVYLGLGTGLEHPTGLLGVAMDLAIHPQASLGGGIGLSSWGAKVSAEGRFYFEPYNRGPALGVGFSSSAGGRARYRLETVEWGEETIYLNRERVSNLFVAAYYFIRLGKAGHRFYVQGGGSYRLSDVDYTYQDNYGLPTTLTEDAKNVLRVVAPGGAMAGVGFSFAVGR